jgi:hypothetical protein
VRAINVHTACRLDSRENNFERGATDVFFLESANIGEASAVVLRHDNKGLASDWHVHSVKVVNTSSGNVKVRSQLASAFEFECNMK